MEGFRFQRLEFQHGLLYLRSLVCSRVSSPSQDPSNKYQKIKIRRVSTSTGQQWFVDVLSHRQLFNPTAEVILSTLLHLTRRRTETETLRAYIKNHEVLGR